MNDLLIAAPDLIVLAQDTIVLAQAPTSGAGGVINSFITGNAFIRSVIQAAGVLLFFMLLGKFVWDKRKGQGGGQGGGLGQIALGLLAAAAIFVPAFLGTIVDTGIQGATGLLNTAASVFGNDTGFGDPGDPGADAAG